MRFRPSDLFTVFVIFVLVGAVAVASQWVLRASIIILVLGSIGAVLATAQLLMDCFLRDRAAEAPARPTMELPSFEDKDPKATLWGTFEIWGWLLGMLVLIRITGLDLALPLFVLIYAKFYGASWRLAILLTLMIGAFIFGVYEQIMHVYWPESVFGDLFMDRLRGED
ncbi:MAG: hypothetical protein R3229_07405 [Alphaproteobacteria bacterium]|nr:hypothetical protein [Alphaproteobacteria bacterium]